VSEIRIGSTTIRRGEYLGIADFRRRVLRADATTLTVRDAHWWPVEWVRARYENARWWLADCRLRVRR
jgi:hypothetical protein